MPELDEKKEKPASSDKEDKGDSNNQAHEEFKQTLRSLNETNKDLLGQTRALGGTLGRLRSELGLPKDADEKTILATLAALKDPAKDKESREDGKGKISQKDIDKAREDIIKAKDREFGAERETLVKDRDDWKTAFLADRVETEVTKACAKCDPPLDPDIVLALINSPSTRVDWKLEADPDRHAKKKVKILSVEDDSPFFSKEHAKPFELSDALSDLAKKYPSAQLLDPQTSTGAGRFRQNQTVRPKTGKPDQESATSMIAEAFK